ncbi:MAG: hypothetical protein MPN21_16035 [Thermoanaerobaculia bacterium]|nr:hypothetical protein [Thermoanaerobaculia bacterium]
MCSELRSLPSTASDSAPAFGRRVWRPFRILLLLSSLLLPLVACGKKGPPLPPIRVIPIQIQDLALRQQGSLMMLDMAYPTTTVAGTSLGGIDSVELWVLTKPLGAEGEAPSAEPAEFVAGAEQLMALRGSELQSAIVGSRIQIRLPLEMPEQETGDIFAVRTLKGEEVSRFSNRVTLVPTEPPVSPSRLHAEATASGIRISWEYEGEAEGFQIFRREATERGYGAPVRKEAGDRRRTLDRTAQFGKRYIYTVRTVGSREPLVLSEPAGEREIEYLDRFAPPLPSNVVALPERGGVRLRWEPSDAPDVKGYRIYRTDPTQRGEWHLITPDPIDALEYSDRGLSPGVRFSYRLQVVDHEGNESDPSPPVSATPR